MADRLSEMGADFAAYGVHHDEPEAALRAADWARKHGLGIMLNNPICQINAPRTAGFQTWVYPPDLVAAVRQRADLIGVIYDELIHHQIHPGWKGHTNDWTAVADVSECRQPAEAYQAVEAGLRSLFSHSAPTGVPACTEQVIPALLHAVARCGGVPGCKVLKEQISPISLSLCMSAARQYATPWFATVDLWGYDSGPWYQMMACHSGHSPVEYLNALKLLALLNPRATLTESADVLWVVDSPDAELTEFGEVLRRFCRELRPHIQPAFDVATWQPTIAFVRAEDGCYAQPDVGYLLGCPELPVTPAAAKWLRAWYHLTWGRCTGNSLWNYFDPEQHAIARQNVVGGDEHHPEAAPPLAERRDPSRRETHMHPLFTPLNNVASFDHFVTPQDLQGVALLILCGSSCSAETQAVVQAAVREGACCVCQEECVPSALRQAAGRKLGRGYWWTVPDFDDASALQQFIRYRGQPNQWVLRSGLGTLRIHATDAWCNEIAAHLEH
jgi:hypothetical protein